MEVGCGTAPIPIHENKKLNTSPNTKRVAHVLNREEKVKKMRKRRTFLVCQGKERQGRGKKGNSTNRL
jgi:hypothetical protein